MVDVAVWFLSSDSDDLSVIHNDNDSENEFVELSTDNRLTFVSQFVLFSDVFTSFADLPRQKLPFG